VTPADNERAPETDAPDCPLRPVRTASGRHHLPLEPLHRAGAQPACLGGIDDAPAAGQQLARLLKPGVMRDYCDIDFERRIIRINHAMHRRDGTLCIVATMSF